MKNFIKSRSAASAAEYGLLAALISATALTAVSVSGLSVSNVFDETASSIEVAGSGSNAQTPPPSNPVNIETGDNFAVSLFSASIPQIQADEPFSFDFKTLIALTDPGNATSNDLSWTINPSTPLPSGLNFDTQTGVLSGTLSQSSIGQSSEFEIIAELNGETASEIFQVAVQCSLGGFDWTLQSSPSSTGLENVRFLNNRFMAVGFGGRLMTSTNGEIWTVQSTPTTEILLDVEYANGLYVAVGGTLQGGRVIITSPDGINWTNNTPGGSGFLKGIAYGDGKFVTGGLNGSILTSTDGVSWQNQSSGTSERIFDMIYENGQFIAVGWSGTILTSPDGENWSSQTPPIPNSLFGITYNDGLYIATGSASTILTSTDTINWTQRIPSPQLSTSLRRTVYAANTFLSVGQFDVYAYSFDGVNWSMAQTGISSGSLEGVAYGNDVFVAVGAGNKILTSPPACIQ